MVGQHRHQVLQVFDGSCRGRFTADYTTKQIQTSMRNQFRHRRSLKGNGVTQHLEGQKNKVNVSMSQFTQQTAR